MTQPYPFVSSIRPTCPQTLLDRARTLRVPRVALVNAGAPKPLLGLREAADHGLAEPILIGDRAKIAASARRARRSGRRRSEAVAGPTPAR
jgi:phosphate acetyltransferase